MHLNSIITNPMILKYSKYLWDMFFKLPSKSTLMSYVSLTLTPFLQSPPLALGLERPSSENPKGQGS